MGQVYKDNAGYTLITGASGYLGRAFCLECLARGEKLYLTGRSGEKLAVLRDYLISIYPSAEIVTFACDLTKEEERAALFRHAEKFTFRRLINVAGADIQKPFAAYTEEKLVFQTRICFEAAASLCRFVLSRKSDCLSIVNISSVSGIVPMPYFALYSACKGALTSFSLALAAETKGEGVRVTAVLPGAVYTRPDVVEYIAKQGVWGKIAAMVPQKVAAKAMRASDRGKTKVIIGAANRVMHAALACVPLKIKLKFIAARWSKTQKDAF